MKTEATAVACKRTGPASTYNFDSTSVEGPANAGLGKGLRDDVRGGRGLSDQVGAADVLACRMSPEPGAENTDRQMALPVDVLRELVQAQVRRECRRWDFDWDAFVADGPEWCITEVVHRRAVQQEQERDRGLDLRPTDIPTDSVLSAVRDVIAEWTNQPELRPTYDAFCQEQARRGDKGRETQQTLTVPRNAEILALVAKGVPDAEIARRVGLHRSQVGRIRKAAATAFPALQEVGEAPSFPAPRDPSGGALVSGPVHQANGCGSLPQRCALAGRRRPVL